MGLRSRFRSVVLELALVAVEGLVSRLELVEDKLMDLSEPLELDSDLEDDFPTDLPGVFRDRFEGMLDGPDVEDLEKKMLSSSSGRLHPISFVDAETGLPVILLKGIKERFGPSCQLVLPVGALSHWSHYQVVGIQVSIHSLCDDKEGEEEQVGVPLYGRNFRIDDGLNLFSAIEWNPLSEFTSDRYSGDILSSMGHPGLREYPEIDGPAGIALEIALGPLGRDRKEPHYVSVSLMVRILEDRSLSFGKRHEQAVRSQG